MARIIPLEGNNVFASGVRPSALPDKKEPTAQDMLAYAQLGQMGLHLAKGIGDAVVAGGSRLLADTPDDREAQARSAFAHDLLTREKNHRFEANLARDKAKAVLNGEDANPPVAEPVPAVPSDADKVHMHQAGAALDAKYAAEDARPVIPATPQRYLSDISPRNKGDAEYNQKLTWLHDRLAGAQTEAEVAEIRRSLAALNLAQGDVGHSALEKEWTTSDPQMEDSYQTDQNAKLHMSPIENPAVLEGADRDVKANALRAKYASLDPEAQQELLARLRAAGPNAQHAIQTLTRYDNVDGSRPIADSLRERLERGAHARGVAGQRNRGALAQLPPRGMASMPPEGHGSLAGLAGKLSSLGLDQVQVLSDKLGTSEDPRAVEAKAAVDAELSRRRTTARTGHVASDQEMANLEANPDSAEAQAAATGLQPGFSGVHSYGDLQKRMAMAAVSNDYKGANQVMQDFIASDGMGVHPDSLEDLITGAHHKRALQELLAMAPKLVKESPAVQVYTGEKTVLEHQKGRSAEAAADQAPAQQAAKTEIEQIKAKHAEAKAQLEEMLKNGQVDQTQANTILKQIDARTEDALRQSIIDRNKAPKVPLVQIGATQTKVDVHNAQKTNDVWGGLFTDSKKNVGTADRALNHANALLKELQANPGGDWTKLLEKYPDLKVAVGSAKDYNDALSKARAAADTASSDRITSVKEAEEAGFNWYKADQSMADAAKTRQLKSLFPPPATSARGVIAGDYEKASSLSATKQNVWFRRAAGSNAPYELDPDTEIGSASPSASTGTVPVKGAAPKGHAAPTKAAPATKTAPPAPNLPGRLPGESLETYHNRTAS